MTEKALIEFLAAPTSERMAKLRTGEHEVLLRQYFGDAAYDDYAALADRLDESHLSASSPPNLIFCPGVMGSLLKSDSKGGVWWIDVRSRNHLNDLRLSDDGSIDANPDDQVSPFTSDATYDPFLTAVLQHDELGHRIFPYDWRKSLTASADGLADLIEAAYEENGGNPVNLLGHSMGGLMIRASLMKHGKRLWPKIGRVVFVATPHYGSPAIAGYLKNHLWGFDLLALLGIYLTRETFRSLWGVLAMLPAPPGIYPGTRENESGDWSSSDYKHPCANYDLYSAPAWHLELDAAAEKRLQNVLDGAAEFHKRMAESNAALTQDQRDKMRMIAGVGYKTLFRIEFHRHAWGLWERAKKVTNRIPGNRHREGDGRVPLASAELEGLETHYVVGVHGGLANIPAVYDAAFGFFNGGDLELPRTPEDALSQHLASPNQSDAPSLDGSARALPGSDDPQLWLETDDAKVAKLKAELEAGTLPEFDIVRMM
jgi:pimeloyl-ACP methyl ester carboxylesterase